MKLFWVIVLVNVNNTLFSQNSIEGFVKNAEEETVSGAVVSIAGTTVFTVTNDNGYYSFSNLLGKVHNLTVKANGYKGAYMQVQLNSEDKAYIDFVLYPDFLELSSVIVSAKNTQKTRFLTSGDVASHSLEDTNTMPGIANLLSSVPGIYGDGSTGEVFTRVYSRGISISAEDDIGWYYVSLEEDGMPVTSVQFNSFSPDFFFRTDLAIEKLEVLNGGKSSVLNSNAPGATFNFVSKSGLNRDKLKVTTGVEGEGNYMSRIDAFFSGMIGKKWIYNTSGFFRNAEGARNTPLNWSRGGQIKLSIEKPFLAGHFKIYAKYLNDKVNRWTGVAATNWNAPQAAFGQNFSSTALMLPPLSTRVADGKELTANPMATMNYNPDKGIKTIDYTLGFEYFKKFTNGSLQNNFKISYKSAQWKTAIGNQPIGLEEFTPYVMNGISPDFSVLPLGNVVFRDTKTGELVASVNNYGILDSPATFVYNEGSLPYNSVMGIAPWVKDDQLYEVMNRVLYNQKFNKHSITTGAYISFTGVQDFTSASYAYSTYEPVPRMLRVTLENEDEPIVELSDLSGISNYGGLFYNNARANVFKTLLFVDDECKVAKYTSVNLSASYSYINYNGGKDRFSNAEDLDNNTNTAYNNSTLSSTGILDNFNDSYHNLSFSLGLHHILNKNTSLFGRISLGNKVPELNYYFDNFQNTSIKNKGEVQKIKQYEAGFKQLGKKVDIAATFFWSILSNVGHSEFVFDETSGSLFYSPLQFNKTNTLGITIDAVYHGIKNFPVRLSATFQNPNATKYTIYNTGGTVEAYDDTILDYSGNILPHNPKLTFSIKPTYAYKKIKVFAQWEYIGKREGNIANAFQLPAFNIADLGVVYNVNKHLSLGLTSNNIFNSTGLMNFFGPNEFGSNANEATENYIAENPDASFVVFPVMPRTIYLKTTYSF